MLKPHKYSFSAALDNYWLGVAPGRDLGNRDRNNRRDIVLTLAATQ
jgi:hypothetical protein